MLKLTGVGKSFGGVRAVVDVDLEVRDGEIAGLIGPNGSGKTTIINLITGLFPVTAGTIALGAADITNVPTHRRIEAGIGRTFQNIRLFPQLTVWENVWVATRPGPRTAGRPRILGAKRAAREAAREILESAGLARKADELACNLAFGEQRRLELARAVATGPKLLLLDEPAAGMTIAEIVELEQRLRDLRARGLTILLVEHHMALVMRTCDRVTVLNFGRKIASGTPNQVQSDPKVQSAYLGTPSTVAV